MITIFNQKTLLITTDAMELSRVKVLLDKARIKYSVKTSTSRGVVGRSIDVNIHRAVNQSYGGAELSHTYYLYVRKRDYSLAKNVISTK